MSATLESAEATQIEIVSNPMRTQHIPVGPHPTKLDLQPTLIHQPIADQHVAVSRFLMMAIEVDNHTKEDQHQLLHLEMKELTTTLHPEEIRIVTHLQEIPNTTEVQTTTIKEATVIHLQLQELQVEKVQDIQEVVADNSLINTKNQTYMRFRIIPIAIFSAIANLAAAQNATDALRFSQTFVKGSARFTAMGGAFGALGGDISSLMINPAGLGVYRSSEFTFSTGIFNANIHTNYRNSTLFANHTSVNVGNAGIVMPVYSSSSTPIRNFNIGIAYNRVNDYNLNTSLTGLPEYRSTRQTDNSMMYYMKALAYRGKLTTEDLNSNFNPSYPGDWLPMLAYGNKLLQSPNNTGNDNRIFNTPLLDNDVVFQDQNTQTRGFNDLINISFASNIMDVVYIGASLNITNINFTSSNFYTEEGATENKSDFKSFYYDQYYKAYGTGYSLSIGAILKPIQELRIGISYQSPTWTFIDDSYYAGMVSNYHIGEITPPSDNSYRINSPQRLTGSIAAVISKFAIVSADIEWQNYSNMKIRLKEDAPGTRKYENIVNSNISNNYRNTLNYRLGVEFKLNNNLSLRGGYQYYQNPFKDGIVLDSPTSFYSLADGYNGNAGKGLNKPIQTYSTGVGYRTRSFFIDFAYSLTKLKNNYSLYDFYDEVNDPQQGNTIIDIYSGTATQNINKNAYILTVGFKF